MQRYIDSTLIPDEKIILTPEIHSIVYIKPFIILGLYLSFMLVVGLIDPTAWLTLFVILIPIVLSMGCWILYDRLYYPRVEMAVSNKRVVCKKGIISVHSEELQWNKIESIEIRQGILGRIFGYGDVFFSGTGASFVEFETVKDPWVVKSKAADILSK